MGYTSGAGFLFGTLSPAQITSDNVSIAAEGTQRDKIERLARYVSRPPVATERLSLTASRRVPYALKTPYRAGTTQVIFQPEEFMARIAVPDETCRQCGGRLRVIASIKTPAVIDRVLEHLGRDAESVDPADPCRAPPERDCLI